MRLSVILAAAMALQMGTTVLLNWQAPANSSDPAVGYNVYRTDSGKSDWVKINRDLVPSPTYRDETVKRGRSYSYSVRSVDAKGVESAPSQPWSVTIPKKSKQKIIEPKQTSQ